MFRCDGPSSKVLYVKEYFTANVPNEAALLEFCKNNSPKYNFHTGDSILTVNGKMEQSEYRDLLAIYPRQAGVHTKLKSLLTESQLYLSENDLDKLQTFAKRIRGEILFARAWLLCEGQSEYLLIRYFAELLKTPLDNAGITVIDFQNNGSPGAFVGLAQVFEIPWNMVCDNDSEGKQFIRNVENHVLWAWSET